MNIAPHAYMQTRDTDRPIWYQTGLVTIKATASQTDGAFGLIDTVLPVGFGTPLHLHHREDESFYLMDGVVRFVCGDNDWIATAGAFVFLPRGVAHAFKVCEPTRMLNFITPGGFEQFFADLGTPAQAPILPPVGAPITIPQFVAASKAYHVEIAGPPLV